MTPPTSVETRESTEDLLRELYADARVLTNRQSEINRRLGLLEAKVDRILSLEGTVADLEASNEKRSTWRDWAIQTPLGAVLTMVAIWAATKMGIPLVGP